MKLSHWAKQQGISYLTAFRWFQSGKLPVRYQQMPSGSIIVYPEEKNHQQEKVIIYCRVSSRERKNDLTYQINVGNTIFTIPHQIQNISHLVHTIHAHMHYNDMFWYHLNCFRLISSNGPYYNLDIMPCLL